MLQYVCPLQSVELSLMTRVERDSPRDQLVVTFFCLIIIGMLLFAAIRSR